MSARWVVIDTVAWDEPWPEFALYADAKAHVAMLRDNPSSVLGRWIIRYADLEAGEPQ